MSRIVHTEHNSVVLIIEGDELRDLQQLLIDPSVRTTLLLEHHASGQLTASWS